ncbi:phage portal protein [Microbacterium sp. BG28]|uniref:phage portal protein n=1 Tax=Microbacterium sp. BG28 TaxID=3097356 RepID=UPI002A5A4A90|nr:phage portal protein [Microbacterium sp. BG28]MDY0828579.1 phage portal protein [Microbacterium sp. BG28]
MDVETGKRRAALGFEALRANEKKAKEREDYTHGVQRDPWAPEGIGNEHLELRRQSKANWINIAVFAPIQRLRFEGIRTGQGKDTDKKVWRDFWHANRLEARQSIIYESMMTHGRGIVSVWPNLRNMQRPIVRPQSMRNVYLHADPGDPFVTEWSLKVVERKDVAPNGFIVPAGIRPATTLAYVYDDDSWMRLRLEGGKWEHEDDGFHPLKANPMVTYDYRPNANSEIFSPVDPLIPQQDAINTIRFNMLLAMQFSAFRQRIVTGFDPVMRDEAGQIVYKKNPDGSIFTTPDGRMVPLMNDFGRAAVDRMLVFNGHDTKVFDMPESNLANYVTMLTEFLTQFFATAQVPPQYLLSRMANLSGDAISGAESTLTSLLGELKRYVQEGHVEAATLWSRAAGLPDPDPDMELLAADMEVKSFGQIIDGIQKLVTTGFPREGAWEMIPGANQAKVARWMDMSAREAQQELDALKGEVAEEDDTSQGIGQALQLAAPNRG